MEALTSSSMKLLVESSGSGSSSRGRALSSSRPSFIISRAHKIGFDRNYLRLAISAPLIPSLHRVTPLSSQSQAEAAKDLFGAIDQSNNVRVRIELRKECIFGEQFLLVGDDAIFGAWDPTNAIPLEWSDGHIWTTELDMPIGKSIQFKFILKGATGEIVWQPGPDRVLQTWETKNLIVISEDWENAEIQKVSEEELTVTANSKLFVEANTSCSQEKDIAHTDDGSIVADNIVLPKDELVADSKKTEENVSFLTEETRTNANNESTTSEKKPHFEVNNKEETSVIEDSLGSNGTFVTENPKIEYNLNSESAYNLVDYEGEPILVPGLNPFPTPTTSTMGYSEVESSAIDASVGDNEVENPDVPEEEKSLKVTDGGADEEANDVVSGLEETQLIQGHEQHNQQASDNDFLENDIRWGRKTLERFFANLGLF